MKMSFPYARYTVIIFFLTTIVVQSFGELIVLRKPPTDDNKTRELTCISEDDDSALIWNLEYQDDIAVLQPKTRKEPANSRCAIHDSENCICYWILEKSGWRIVSSADKPMGPVFDYRWEDFREFDFKESVEEPNYSHVRTFMESHGTAVFSVRGSGAVYIILCEYMKERNNFCHQIVIGGSNGTGSSIRTCTRESVNMDKGCRDVAAVTHESTILDPYEWRTFRIEWSESENVIQVFENTEDMPFLTGDIYQLHSHPELFVKSKSLSRIRFHFYDYFMTEDENEEISTSYFDLTGRSFCIELLVGLCPHCRLEISLMTTRSLASRTFSRDENLADGSLLTWRSINFNVTFPYLASRYVNLKIKTILKDGTGGGQWAVDSFRKCKPDGWLRKSTITIHRETVDGISKWPSACCQKLSHTNSAVVDSLSKGTIYHDTYSFKKFIDRVSNACGSMCEWFDEKWSICKPTGCACNRGYRESDCSKKCDEGFYGYNCNKRCGTCGSGYCDKITGHCSNCSEVDELLPPFCKKELDKPIVVGTTDSMAIIRQNMEFQDGLPSRLYLKIQERKESYYSTNPEEHEVKITNLEANETYTAQTVAVSKTGTIEVKSPEITFTTTPLGTNCFKVDLKKRDITVSLNRDLMGCTAFSGQSHLLKLQKIGSEHIRKMNLNLPVTVYRLTPYTKYQLTIFGYSNTLVWNTTVRTLPSAPGMVSYLRSQEITDTTVVLEWGVPEEKNGEISKYRVSIQLNKLLGCDDLQRRTPAQNEISTDVNDTMKSFGDLHPYAEYTAYVIAHTSEAGPNKSRTFQTNQKKIPTSIVSNLELVDDNRRLEWSPPENCVTISGPISDTRLHFRKVIGRVSNTIIKERTSDKYSDLTSLSLTPYTLYNVRVYVARNSYAKVNLDLYQEKNWTTAPAAPSAVRGLGVYDADPDTNTIPLRWQPPEPVNGEIESYHVSITQGNKRSKDWTIKVSEGIPVCELWSDYICFRNLTLPSEFFAGAQVQLQVYARNKNVQPSGISHPLPFTPNFYYNQAPGQPLNLRANNQSYGIVTLTWLHPSISRTKITQFRIIVETQENYLLDIPSKEFSMRLDHTVTQNQKEYNRILHLLPSTKYRISVEAVNGRNMTSRMNNITYKVPGSVGFAIEDEQPVKFDGTLIEVKIPTVINATRNTTVEVIVNGLSTCAGNQSHQSPAPVNQTSLSVMKWDAAVYQIGNESPEPLKIFVKQHTDGTSKCSLHLEETYTIMFRVTDWYTGNWTTLTKSPITLIDPEEYQTKNLVWLIILPIVAIPLLIYIWHRKRSKTRLARSERNILQLGSMISSANSTAPSTLKHPIPTPDATVDRVLIRQSSPDVVPTYNPNSYPVEVENFEEYTKEALARGLLNPQYEMFSKKLSKSCDYGMMIENGPKNRYKDRIPYDKTRVVLDEIPGEPHSDYINASYIQGHGKRRAYIATQGPKSKTIKDFWRMVWQENVRVICMLANIIEGGKRKCEQYWPEVATKIKYGNIVISNTKHQVFADYTFRTFLLRYNKETREVTHLHYTGWPDHGVPMYTQSLVAYLKKLLATPAGSGPVVVHCSAGVGRTGTIILCDICLRQAVAERIIDVPAAMVRMREERPNMVDNAQQYLLAHLAIVESMIVEQTQIPCNSFLPQKIMELKKQLPSDIQRLNETVWQDQALHCSESVTHRSQGDFTTNPTCVSESNSIGAVNVVGVKKKNQYLAGRLPSTSTLSDFWTLIAEKNIELVVVLQCFNSKDRTYCEIVPGDSVLIPIPSIQVERKANVEKKEHLTIDKLLLTDTSEEEERLQPVTVITCTGWGHGKRGRPPTVTALVSLWIASEKIARKEGQTLVLCRDGVTCCGLYLALSFLLERIAVERECDVISAVRAVRRSRTEFVQSLEQFEYLYDAALDYVKSFEIYANFS